MTTVHQPDRTDFGSQTGFELQKRRTRGWSRTARRGNYKRGREDLAKFGSDADMEQAFRRVTKAVRTYVWTKLDEVADLRAFAKVNDRYDRVQDTLTTMRKLAAQVRRLEPRERYILSQELANSYHRRHPNGRLTNLGPRYFQLAPLLIADLVDVGDRRALATPKIGHRPRLDAARTLAGAIVDAWQALGKELTFSKPGIIRFTETALNQIVVKGAVDLVQIGEAPLSVKPLKGGRERICTMAFPAKADVTKVVAWVGEEITRRKMAPAKNPQVASPRNGKDEGEISLGLS